MKTVQEILEWIDETAAESLSSFKEEPSKNSNHLATAYFAEYELLKQLKEWIHDL